MYIFAVITSTNTVISNLITMFVFLHFLIKYMEVLGGVHMFVQDTGGLWRSENILGESILSFYLVSPED